MRSGLRGAACAAALAAVLAAGLLAPGAGAQVAPGRGGRADLPAGAQGMADMQARFARWKAEVPPGTGPLKVVREEPAGLPDHTVFRPADLSKGRYPIIAFANGGCRTTPIEFTAFLSELASHGYFIVAAGRNDNDFATANFSGRSANGKPLQSVSRKVLTEAIDWAVAENGRRGSPYRGRLATGKIAYMGQSCGGMQALSASTDPRATTTVVLNSGRFARVATGPSGGAFSEWFEWPQLHAPIAFFLGGPSDVRIGDENVKEIEKLPVFLADLPVGHTGAYPQPDPRWSKAVLGWLDWRLKGDAKGKRLFVGPSCGLCVDGDWKVGGQKNLG